MRKRSDVHAKLIDFTGDSGRMSRFWRKVARCGDSQCWNWLGALNSNGYGTFYVPPKVGVYKYRIYQAHRVAWVASHGNPVNPELRILHKCDNRRCCNPAHMQLGTSEENTRDRVSKRRSAHGAGAGGSKLSEEQARSLLKRLCSGESPTLLARESGLALRSIHSLKRRETWRHL